ncbi:MAG: hypothetical protein IT370_10430 [Deltaproteobacteria bacterium]|nr:hypothetical protein [Deltaproteobacteria bacterium]
MSDPTPEDAASSYLAAVRREAAAREAAQRAGTWREPTDPRRAQRRFGVVMMICGAALIVLGGVILVLYLAAVKVVHGQPTLGFPTRALVALGSGISLVAGGQWRRFQNRDSDD